MLTSATILRIILKSSTWPACVSRFYKVTMSSHLIQYVIVRGDLPKEWNIGSVIAQACHGCCAVTHLFYNDPYTQEYLKDLNNMHKVVLKVPTEDNLKQLATQLKENCIDHIMWIEQPENFPTCIVMKPYPKEEVRDYVKDLKLLRKI